MDVKKRKELLNRYEEGETELFDVLEKEYSKLVEENPENIKYMASYGLLYQILGMRQLEKAEKIYERGLFKQDTPQSGDEYFRIDTWLLNLRNTLGKNKDTIELYKRRILEYPNETDEYVFLAIAYLKVDQVQEAKKVMEAAEKIAPAKFTNSYSHCNFYEIYGDVYSRLGDNEKALSYWDKAVISEFGMGGWIKRAFMFKDLGRLEEATSEWKKIIELLKKHDNPQFLDWPKEELRKIEEQLNK